MRMKSRLTLTIDPQVMHRAKLYARSRNQSLSSLVEGLLKDVEGGEEEGDSGVSFSKRWGGKLEVASRDEERFQYLSKKYDLE